MNKTELIEALEKADGPSDFVIVKCFNCKSCQSAGFFHCAHPTNCGAWDDAKHTALKRSNPMDECIQCGRTDKDDRVAKENAQKINRQAERIAELKRAMDDLLGSPMGTVPKSAEKFYDSKSGRFSARKSLGENNE